jgi:predicted DNA-binding protein (UPF0251 family)
MFKSGNPAELYVSLLGFTLRCFAGLSEEEAAAALGISRATASRCWTYARAWLINALDDKAE